MAETKKMALIGDELVYKLQKVGPISPDIFVRAKKFKIDPTDDQFENANEDAPQFRYVKTGGSIAPSTSKIQSTSKVQTVKVCLLILEIIKVIFFEF